MLAVGGECRCAAAGLQSAQHGADFGLAEHRLLERLDIANEADAFGDIGRHIGLEGAAADENDDGVQVFLADTKQRLNGLEVLVVLAKRILKFVGALVDLLRPLRLLLAAEDPAGHVLRFQHKDAVAREEDVVDLRGAVRRVQRDVVQAAVGLLVELQVCKQADEGFANVPFRPRRLEQAEQEYGRNEPGQHVEYRCKDKAEVHFLSFALGRDADAGPSYRGRLSPSLLFLSFAASYGSVPFDAYTR